jgi:hypothetical protein
MCDFKSFEKPKKKLEIQYVISKSFENQRKSWGMTQKILWLWIFWFAVLESGQFSDFIEIIREASIHIFWVNSFSRFQKYYGSEFFGFQFQNQDNFLI